MSNGHVGPNPEPSIEAAFRRFHRENPHVYDGLVELARGWQERRGDAKLGIGMLFEVLRWQIALRTRNDDFRLNNNYRSYYARMMMAREPELAGIFELRRLNASEPDLGDA